KTRRMSLTRTRRATADETARRLEMKRGSHLRSEVHNGPPACPLQDGLAVVSSRILSQFPFGGLGALGLLSPEHCRTGRNGIAWLDGCWLMASKSWLLWWCR